MLSSGIKAYSITISARIQISSTLMTYATGAGRGTNGSSALTAYHTMPTMSKMMIR